METKDWIVVGVSGAALLWSIISFVLNKASARRAGERAEEANALARETGRRLTAETELSLIRLINEARIKTNEISIKYDEVAKGKTESSLNADEKRMRGSLWAALSVAVEILLNSYELACGMYLDGGKLDNERFERHYRGEIKLLYEFPEPYKSQLHSVNTSYNAIRKVRDKWWNPEN